MMRFSNAETKISCKLNFSKLVRFLLQFTLGAICFSYHMVVLNVPAEVMQQAMNTSLLNTFGLVLSPGAAAVLWWVPTPRSITRQYLGEIRFQVSNCVLPECGGTGRVPPGDAAVASPWGEELADAGQQRSAAARIAFNVRSNNCSASSFSVGGKSSSLS